MNRNYLLKWLEKNRLFIVFIIFAILFMSCTITLMVRQPNLDNSAEIILRSRENKANVNKYIFLIRADTVQERQWLKSHNLTTNDTYLCNNNHNVGFTFDSNSTNYDLEIYFNIPSLNNTVPLSPPKKHVPRVLYNDMFLAEGSNCLQKLQCNEEYNWMVGLNSDSTIKHQSQPYLTRIQLFLDKVKTFDYEKEILTQKTALINQLIIDYNYRHIRPTIASFIQQPLGRTIIEDNNNNSTAINNSTSSNIDIENNETITYTTTCSKDMENILKELNQYLVYHSFGNCLNTSLPLQEGNPYIYDDYQEIVGINKEKSKEIMGKYKYHLIFDDYDCCSTASESDKMVDRILDVFESGSVPVILSNRKSWIDMLPNGSFVHLANFKNIQQLASFLIDSEQSDPRYKEFFDWRTKKNLIKQWKIRLENQRWLGQLVNIYNYWYENQKNKNKDEINNINNLNYNNNW